MKIDYNAIGAKIKIIRNAKGLTQEELAEKSHLSTVYIGYIENGKRQVSLSALMSIAKTLEVGTDCLLGYQDSYCLNDTRLTGCSDIQTEMILEISKVVIAIMSKNNL